jgi:hypothetical protein
MILVLLRSLRNGRVLLIRAGKKGHAKYGHSCSRVRRGPVWGLLAGDALVRRRMIFIHTVDNLLNKSGLDPLLR